MTPAQKNVVLKLLSDHHIAFAGDRIRLRDASSRPVVNVTSAVFNWLLKWDLLRRKGKRYFINRQSVRQLHGNSWIKKAYKGKARAPSAKIPPHKTRRSDPVGPTLF